MRHAALCVALALRCLLALRRRLAHIADVDAAATAAVAVATATAALISPAVSTRLRLTALACAALRISRFARLARLTRFTLASAVIAVASGASAAGASATVLILANRLRHRMRVRLEAWNHLALDGPFDETFDLREQLMFVHADERHGFAIRPCATGAADTVHIVFRDFRQVEVHHVRQLVDVDPARGDVGGDQHLERAALELGQRARAGALALVAVDRQRRNAALRELFGQAVGTVLGAREHEHLEPVVLAHEMLEQFALAIAIDRVDFLLDRLGRRVAARDLDQRRRLEQAVGQLLYLVGERGREQQVLTFGRQRRQHAPDVADEAHVEHAVGFVEHENLHARQVHRFLLHVVEQTSRRGNENVDAARELLDLRHHRHTAEHGHRRETQILAVLGHALLDLGRQLARGGQHERAHRALAVGRRRTRARREHLQDGQREAGGFAGAGLGAGEEIAALQDGRNRLQLNRSRVGIAEVGDRTQDVGRQAELFKRHI
ncbi:hypothetical protein PPN31119_03838 [Pandoraea pnomenusa]|uniref:Uncharacterized protein n=1 Tax=Pandoraea pnomenusa TaxID=93220 RepID=A0ABY6WS20_9BURK|nr:hypothetical protein PPN31119_03838 [Pandoraea pnomenusa]